MKQLPKNKRDYKKTLKRYGFRKPRKKTSSNEQVGLISIYDPKEEKQKDDLLQDQKVPLHQKEPIQDLIPKKVYILNKKRTKKKNQQVMAINLHGKKVQIHQDDEVTYIFTPKK